MNKISDNCGFSTRLSRFGENNRYETEVVFRLTAKTMVEEQGPFGETQPASVRVVVNKLYEELYGDIEQAALDLGVESLLALVRSKRA